MGPLGREGVLCVSATTTFSCPEAHSGKAHIAGGSGMGTEVGPAAAAGVVPPAAGVTTLRHWRESRRLVHLQLHLHLCLHLQLHLHLHLHLHLLVQISSATSAVATSTAAAAIHGGIVPEADAPVVGVDEAQLDAAVHPKGGHVDGGGPALAAALAALAPAGLGAGPDMVRDAGALGEVVALPVADPFSVTA